jgi:hypothetical protein
MPDTIITCPQCTRPLRVPDTMFGRLVKCPTCAVQFQVAAGGPPRPVDAVAPATEGSASPPPVPPPLPDASPPPGEVPPPSYAPPPAYAPSTYSPPEYAPVPPYAAPPADESALYTTVLAPAICLLLTALLGLAANVGLAFFVSTQDPEQMAQQTIQGFPQQTPEQMRMGLVIYQVMFSACAFGSLIVLLGAVQMMRLRTHWLAVAASVVPFVLICPGCCVLGAPFGIWSLIVLLRPDVRALFR